MRIVLIVLASAAIAGAQSRDAERPTFEVVSVKPNKSGDRMVRFEVQPGGRFFASNVPLTFIIRAAYTLVPWQIVDAPSWADSERFDITAVSDRELKEPAMRPGGEFAPVQLMLQSLLADRFNLRAHLEERQTQVYALVRDQRASATNKLIPGKPCDPDCGMSRRPGGLNYRGPITILVDFLSEVTGRLVTDATGLVGIFDIDLRWSQDPNAIDGISIFTALSDQLGLRLETRKGTVSMLVIDSVDRPTSN